MRHLWESRISRSEGYWRNCDDEMEPALGDRICEFLTLAALLTIRGATGSPIRLSATTSVATAIAGASSVTLYGARA